MFILIYITRDQMHEKRKQLFKTLRAEMSCIENVLSSCCLLSVIRGKVLTFKHNRPITTLSNGFPSGCFTCLPTLMYLFYMFFLLSLYSGGDDLGQFNIRSTGEIYVNKPLDHEVMSEYQLTVSATDGAFVSTASVKISILDANDNAPTCDQVTNNLYFLYFSLGTSQGLMSCPNNFIWSPIGPPYLSSANLHSEHCE